jgi:putative membrane protein
MPLQWWCSATGIAWSWSWRAYPGVWIMILLLALLVLVRRPPAMSGGQRVWWLLGCSMLWVALDWPIGTLGAGYLLSAHALQFLLIVYVAAPLLLCGLPAAWLDGVGGRAAIAGALRFATHPVVAGAVCAAALIVSHVPFVLDTLRPSQLGSFALDIAWVVAGLLLWWPVIVAVPARRWFPAPVKMLYLFVTGLPCVGVGIVLTLTDLPLYGLYELAPRVESIPARVDQQAAGILMWVVAHLMTLAAISVVFFQWARRDEPGPPARERGETSLTTIGRIALVVLTLMLASIVAAADDLPAPLKHAQAGQVGEVLTDAKGMTLYTFTNDTEPGKSACSGSCASNWPPFRPVAGDPAPKPPLSVITRDDGGKQYAYKGKPLYFWKNDKKPGDTRGHNFAKRWFVATP